MSAAAPTIVTAGLRPELFAESGAYSLNRTLLALFLSVLVIAGFGFRVRGLGAEGLSEDELHKLDAVLDYRAHGGLTSANGEHPLMMKALLTITIVGAEKWNATSLVSAHPDLNVSIESALRFPNALFGALTAILIFLLTSELFGREAGLIASALWALDPLAISFNRIGKEDTLLVFFFLLANVLWLRGQRAAESQSSRNPEIFYWATAAAFGLMLASKYYPQMIAISVAYNYAFQRIPTRWVIGKARFLKFFLVMAVVFLVFNPSIFLPGSWHAIFNFTSYRAMGHDSYEFMGRLYPHRFTDWLRGEPWYFYFVLIGVKLPVLTLISSAIGFILLFRKKIGDGRFFIIFWFFFWAVTFVFAGGKFTRYFTSVLPAVLIVAALGVQFSARWLGKLCATILKGAGAEALVRATIVSLVIIASVWSSTTAAPHYRLYMNALGGSARAGYFFPQDEFYDAYMQDTMTEIARRAPANVRVASELPTVAAYYGERANRHDLDFLELSDPADLRKLTPGDFVIDGRGRTYFSNQAMLFRLRAASNPAFTILVGEVPAADVYVLDQHALNALRGQ